MTNHESFPDEPIRPRDRDAVIQAVRAGVVPRVGLRLLQVGRVHEVSALVRDVERIGDGGSTVRFVTADYGGGKTFTLEQIASLARDRRLVTSRVDLTGKRRLAGGDGHTRSTFRELTANLATRTQPNGGALSTLVERFISNCLDAAQQHGRTPDEVIAGRLAGLADMPYGYDFAAVIRAYWRAHEHDDDQRCADALRWLRGEFDSKGEARTALGVRSIIDDNAVYPALKLLSQLARLAGYRGLLVCVDELVSLYRLANTHARKTNYEALLNIVNDGLQGTAVGLGMILAITPEMLYDTRRGMFSYAALHQRLAENSFAAHGLADYSGPVLRLNSLSAEELFVLLTKLRHIVAHGDPNRYLVPDEALHAFMQHCRNQIGDSYFKTPRLTIKAFVDLLMTLEQHPHIVWTDLLAHVTVTPEYAAPDTIDLVGTDPATPSDSADGDHTPPLNTDNPHAPAAVAATQPTFGGSDINDAPVRGSDDDPSDDGLDGFRL